MAHMMNYKAVLVPGKVHSHSAATDMAQMAAHRTSPTVEEGRSVAIEKEFDHHHHHRHHH
jgi:hypothetical protein